MTKRLSIGDDEFDVEKFIDKSEDDEELDSTVNNTQNGQADHRYEFLRDACNTLLLKGYKEAATYWNQVGASSKTRDQRTNEFYEFIVNCFEEIGKSEKAVFEECQHYRTEKLAEVSKMLSDLNLPPYVVDDGLTLIKVCKNLKRKYHELLGVKREREEKIRELREKQTEFCKTLGIQTPLIKLLSGIPSENEIMQLQTAVSDLQVEVRRRQKKHVELKESLTSLMLNLEWTPMNDFESRVTTVTDLSETHLKQMSNLREKLEAEYAKNRKKFDALKNRLDSLYEVLDVPDNERELSNFTPECKPSFIKQLEQEVAKYEELKRQNIGKFVDKCREQLGMWYDKCFISQEERDNFLSLPIQKTEYSEEMLELHEKELERMQKYYEDNKAILEKFQKWQGMWLKLIEFESRANDPNRLNNRGGQLLIEEKQRKALQKGLPKVEKELKDLTKIYEDQHHGKKFMILDSDLETFIAGCWDELHQAKETEKKERQRSKQQTAMCGPSGRRAAPATPGGGMGLQRTPVKRSAGNTETPTPHKLQRTGAGNRPIQTPQSLGHSAYRSIITSSTSKTQSSRSLIPGPRSLRQPLVASNVMAKREDASKLSIDEQEFERVARTCPTSAKKK